MTFVEFAKDPSVEAIVGLVLALVGLLTNNEILYAVGLVGESVAILNVTARLGLNNL